jgi:hypothetical protein
MGSFQDSLEGCCQNLCDRGHSSAARCDMGDDWHHSSSSSNYLDPDASLKLGTTKPVCDEYVWSKRDVNLVNVLISVEHLAQIQICETAFGSNGYIEQPEFIVKSFTKRKIDNKSGILKYFINNVYDFACLNIHYAEFVNKELSHISTFICLIDSDYFRMNHYRCQSQEFWYNIKCTRGDADNYCVRTHEDFIYYDVNEIEELDLYNQNKILYETLN